MAESKLDIFLNFIKKGKGDKEAAAGLKDLEKKQDSAASSSKAFSQIMIGATVALAAFATVAKQAVALTNLDTDVQRANVALSAFAGGAGEAEAALEGVERAAGGTLDKLSATQNAARLFSMGLATNAAEAEKLTRIAITLGAAMGTGPQQAFEDFTLLLANQSIQRLDTFGISSGKVRERIAELTTGVNAMDRETAFMTATIEDAERKMVQLEEAGFEAGSEIEVLSASFKNLKISIASVVAGPVNAWVEGANDQFTAAETLRMALDQGIITQGEYASQLTNLWVTGSNAEEILTDLNEEIQEQTRLTAGADKVMLSYTISTQEAAESTFGLATASAKLNTELGFQSTINQLVVEGMRAGADTAADYALAQFLLKVAVEGTTQAQAEQNLVDIGLISNLEILNGLVGNNVISMGEWTAIMSDGNVSAAELAAAVGGDLNKAIASGVQLTGELLRALDDFNGTNVRATVTISTIGSIPNLVNFSGATTTTASGAVAGATGVNMTVPSGNDNDSFLFAAETGENVQITPAGETPGGNAGNGGGGGGVHIENINLSDPVMLEMLLTEIGMQ